MLVSVIKNMYPKFTLKNFFDNRFTIVIEEVA
jgi:hypothetical protein